MLFHETKLEHQVGNKGALWWSGPFLIHSIVTHFTYTLQEINGTVMRGNISAN